MNEPLDLTQREADRIAGLVAQEYQRVRVSRAKHWRPSTKAMTLAELQRLHEKVRRSYPKQEEGHAT